MIATTSKWLTPLLVLALAEVLAGLVLKENVDLLVLFPVLLILAPGLMDLRGNVYGAIGYRLVKALHLGLSEPKLTTRYNLFNILVGYTVSITATLILVIVGFSFSIILGLGTPEIVSLFFIALQSTVIVYLVLTPVVISTITYIFRSGRDPSPFVATIVTGIGDFLTPATMILVAYLHEFIPYTLKLALILTYVLISLGSLEYIRRYSQLRDLYENLTSSVVASMGSSMGGLALALMASFISENPEILGVVPAFNAVIGAAMGHLGSTLNIDLHLGEESPWTKYRGELSRGLIASYISITVALSLSMVSTPPSIWKLLGLYLVVTLSSLSVYLSSSTVTYALTMATFKHGWDPDNVVFPIMTTFVDLVGPVVLAFIGLIILS